MAVKAASEVTITDNTDIDSLVTWYYLSTSVTKPDAPSTTKTSETPPSPWTQAEPTFTAGTVTNYLYTCVQTRWKDGSCTWGAVQLSSSYEQAKQAWNKAQAAYDATQPIASKTYTGLIGTANDAANASFYFAKVHPDDYNGTWLVKLRVDVTAPTTYQQSIDISISGRANAFMAYDSFVGRSTAALAVYFINLYRAKQAGITAGKGHALGFGLRASTNPTSATYARTITVDVMEQANCTVQLMDTAVKYADMDGTGTTNYEGLTELTVANNGQNATGNSNTSYSQQSPVKAGANGVWGYSLIMQAADGRWNSIFTASSWNGTGTGKSRYTGGFVLGRILYSSGAGTQTSSSSTAATYYRYDTDVATSTTWDVYPFDMRYSTNCATSLVAYKPVYLVGTVGSDGLFYLDATWWTQTLPSTEDGKVYVYIGETYSTYQVYLASVHTALVYSDGGIKTYDQANTEKAKAEIKVTTDGISMEVSKVVEGLTQSSHFVQTEDGFVFSVDDAIDAKQDVGDYATADDLAGAVAGVNADIATKADAADTTAALAGLQGYAEELAQGAQDAAEARAAELSSDAEKTATGFITEISGGGILVHRNDDYDPETEEVPAHGVRISDTVEVVRGGESVAEFGEEFRVGRADQTHMEGSSSKLAFTRDGDDLAWFGQEDGDDPDSPWGLHTEVLYVEDMQRFGQFAWIKRSNGNMTLKWLEA